MTENPPQPETAYRPGNRVLIVNAQGVAYTHRDWTPADAQTLVRWWESVAPDSGPWTIYERVRTLEESIRDALDGASEAARVAGK